MNTRPYYEAYITVRSHLASKIHWLGLKVESLRNASPDYDEVSYNVLNKEEYNSDDPHPRIDWPHWTWRWLALGTTERLAWMLCSAILMLVVAIQHFNIQLHSYETGFATDLGTLLLLLRTTSKTGRKVDAKPLVQLWQYQTSQSKKLSTLAGLYAMARESLSWITQGHQPSMSASLRPT